MPPRTATLRSDLLWTIVVPVIYVAMVLGCCMGTATLDYSKSFPLSTALDAAFHAPAHEAWRLIRTEGVLWFIPSSALLWTGLLIWGRRPRARRIILIGCLVVPYLVEIRGPLAAPFLALLSPLVTLEFVFDLRGETISEGTLTMAAAGWWWFLTAFLLLRARPRRRRPPHECPACRYDRRGLAAGSPCPECGSTAPHPAPAGVPDEHTGTRSAPAAPKGSPRTG